MQTLAETAENVALLIEREVREAPGGDPQVSLDPLAEIVADKGYHSGATILAVERAEARSYIRSFARSVSYLLAPLNS